MNQLDFPTKSHSQSPSRQVQFPPDPYAVEPNPKGSPLRDMPRAPFHQELNLPFSLLPVDSNRHLVRPTDWGPYSPDESFDYFDFDVEPLRSGVEGGGSLIIN